MNFSTHQTLELRCLKLNLGPSFIEKSGNSFVISISTSNINLWNSQFNNDNKREIELFVKYPRRYPSVSPLLAIKIINGDNSLKPDKLIQIAREVADKHRLKSKPCILAIVNQLRNHLRQTTTTTTITTSTAVNCNYNYNVKRTVKSLRRLGISQRQQLQNSDTSNSTIDIITEDEAKVLTKEAKADVNAKSKKRKYRKRKKCNKTDENKRREQNQRSDHSRDNEEMKERLVSCPLQISPKRLRVHELETKLNQFTQRRKIKHDELDRFWDNLEITMNYLKFEVNVESIIFLQTPLNNNINKREFIRDCSLIVKLNVEQCKKLVNDIAYWITNIKQFETELICFNNEIQELCSKFDSDSKKYTSTLNDIVETNQSQYDKLDSFMKIVDNIYGQENFENCLIFKHFSCLAPFRFKNSKKMNNHGDSKNDKNESTNDVISSKLMDIKTQITDEIIYYSTCMVNSLTLQHELALLSHVENENENEIQNESEHESEHERENERENKNENKNENENKKTSSNSYISIPIGWDYDSIRHGQFNFTTYLCEKYFNFGMYREVANLIAIFAGLSKYDYESDQMQNTKTDVNISFIKLNGKMNSKLSLQNIVDNCKKSKWFSNYGKRVPLQSICEIPFDCTK